MKRCLAVIIFFSFFSQSTVSSYSNSPSYKDALPTVGNRTVRDVIKHRGPDAEARIKPFFERAGVVYPPSRVALIALKEERKLEVWAEKDTAWVHVRTYEILGASGGQGPKRRRGDYQVPEGIYQITELNPNSKFHLSMRLNYPNSYDREKAEREKRSNLGGDIFIHGKAKSNGCIAIGDSSIEELFILVAKTGIKNTDIIITPHDLREGVRDAETSPGPSWLPELYEGLEQEMSKFRVKKDS